MTRTDSGDGCAPVATRPDRDDSRQNVGYRGLGGHRSRRPRDPGSDAGEVGADRRAPVGHRHRRRRPDLASILGGHPVLERSVRAAGGRAVPRSSRRADSPETAPWAMPVNATLKNRQQPVDTPTRWSALGTHDPGGAPPGRPACRVGRRSHQYRALLHAGPALLPTGGAGPSPLPIKWSRSPSLIAQPADRGTRRIANG